MRLFLCDDNAHYRRLIRLVLEGAGHEVVGEACDGQDCIDQVASAEPEVVLLDLNMPRVNGFEALPHLREQLPTTKIVILTTGQAPHERQRALEGGADGFIVKPERVFSLPDELQAAVAGEPS
jgi:two-component system chemotaxis response regulator CheY